MRLERFVLPGNHVRLEPLARHHAAALAHAADRDRTSYTLTPVPSTVDAMTVYVEGLLAESERDTVVPFAQVRMSDGAPVGCTRFMNVAWYPGRDTPAEVEVGGTWLAGEAQRTAINTEAKLLLLTQAFERWEVFRVAICTDARNERSRNAIERLGATFEGILRHHRMRTGDGVPTGIPRDTAAYSILPDEWPTIRTRLQERLA